MSKRTIYTVITPLPKTISRETAVRALHNHSEMIELNPSVSSHQPSKPPAQAPPDEFHATWYELTERISYLPGVKGSVQYKACFHNLPKGLQTHFYAPAGLEIKEKWTIGGNENGEEREVLELGLHGVPREGLYLREDVDMRCNMLMTSLVKKARKMAHAVLVERLVAKADLEEDKAYRSRLLSPKLRSGASSIAPNSPSVASLNGIMQTPRSTHTPLLNQMRSSPHREMSPQTYMVQDPSQNGLGIGIAVSSPGPTYSDHYTVQPERRSSPDSGHEVSPITRSTSFRTANRLSTIHNFSSPTARRSPVNTSPTYSPIHANSPAPPYSILPDTYAELPATEKATTLRDVQVRYPTAMPVEELPRNGMNDIGEADAIDVPAPLRLNSTAGMMRRGSSNYSTATPPAETMTTTTRFELE